MIPLKSKELNQSTNKKLKSRRVFGDEADYVFGKKCGTCAFLL